MAEALDVSFQAVSSWERDEYRPETDKLIRLAELLGTSVSSLVEEKKPFKTREAIYDWEHMKTFVKTTDEDRDQVMKMYYDAIAGNPKAALVI